MLNLKALLTKILTQITPIDKSYGSDTIFVRRIGNVVYMNTSATITVTGGSYTNWFTLDTDFRPTATRYMVSVIGGNANVLVLVRVATNGQVSIFCPTTNSNATIWFSGSYMI